MTKEKDASGENQANSVSEEKVEAKNEVVSKKAYEDVSKDMHKFKSKLKEKEAYTVELEVKLKAIEEAKLQDQQQWKELFEKRDSEFEGLQKEITERESQYLNAVKRNAIKSELGGKVKDDYLVHANIDSISFNDDGTINSESLLETANDFRKKHPELIPISESSQATAMASPSNETAGTSLKPLSQLSYDEKRSLMSNPELLSKYKELGLLI